MNESKDEKRKGKKSHFSTREPKQSRPCSSTNNDNDNDLIIFITVGNYGASG